MATTLAIGQTVQLSASPTRNSAPVPIIQTGQGEPVWTTSDATKAAITPSLSSETCVVRGVAAGSATITCTMFTSGGTLTATVSITVSGPIGNVADALAVTVGSVTGP